jgi:cyclic beta-1,2-glucan synthetase
MGFFLFATLGDFLPLCEERGDRERVERYGAHREALRRALDGAGWDGAWYRRGYYDDGTPLGTHEAEECRIDALAQAWAVLSGAAPPERVEQAMDSLERHLVSEDEGLVRLLTPPFENAPHDPGYIKGYVRGVRENGGQYTHAALWVVRAMARLRRNDRVGPLLDLLDPVRHAGDPQRVATYRVEPYVVAADVYGAPPHVGRGGWTWYTGSAGWMYRVAVEDLLGVRMREGRELVVDPCIPDGWPGFSIALRLPGDGTRYELRVRNPSGRAAAVTEATLDGARLPVRGGVGRIPLVRDGGLHRVELVLGVPVPEGAALDA